MYTRLQFQHVRLEVGGNLVTLVVERQPAVHKRQELEGEKSRNRQRRVLTFIPISIPRMRNRITHRLDELKLFPLLHLLDEADVLQPGADEVPLLHLHRRVRLKEDLHDLISIGSLSK